MRLTSHIILNAPIILNPEGQLTLQLRSLKIPYLENLGITQDKFKVLDLTDNDLVELSNIPQLRNLEVLLLGNNNINNINDENLFENNVPNLKSVSLINNNITNFINLRPLSKSNIENLALLGNPIKSLSHYRLFIIWLVPSLKILDFNKIKESERREAKKLFGEHINEPTELALSLLVKSGSDKITDISKEEKNLQNFAKKLTEDDKIELLKQLETAESIEEIERIENTLKTGYL